MNYMDKIGCPLEVGLLNDDQIQHFERGSVDDTFVCKCRFQCPFCEQTVPIVYRNFWMSSNITQHLKSHMCCEVLEEIDEATRHETD